MSCPSLFTPHISCLLGVLISSYSCFSSCGPSWTEMTWLLNSTQPPELTIAMHSSRGCHSRLNLVESTGPKHRLLARVPFRAHITLILKQPVCSHTKSKVLTFVFKALDPKYPKSCFHPYCFSRLTEGALLVVLTSSKVWATAAWEGFPLRDSPKLRNCLPTEGWVCLTFFSYSFCCMLNTYTLAFDG